MLVCILAGLASCSEDYAQTPVITPEGGLGDGSAVNPFTATQVLNGTTVRQGWVTGYIVGWVNTGISNALDSQTATFTTPATVASNLLLAASPDEKDFEKCIPVQVPTGDLRAALNLKDNPGNLGKQVTLKASTERYFGKNEALKSLTAYKWGNQGDSTEEPDTPVTGGNGSADAPFTIGQVLAGQTGNGVWASGYIVGFIKSNPDGASSLNEQWATFSADDAQPSNIMLADSPTEKDYTKCTAVNLPTGAIRAAINLKDNPGNLGKQVTVKGDLTKYFGVNGVKNLTAFAWGGKGEEQGSTTPSGDAIYSGLEEGAASIDWTFDNINMPSSLTYIWSWKEYNGKHYLNGSAFASVAVEAEAIAYSPVVDLAGYSKISLTFDHAAKFQTTLRTLCGFVIREQGTTEWKSIAIPTWPDSGAWTFVSAGVIDLSAYAGKKVEVGFKYGSTASGADTWEIKNLKITGSK